MDFIDLTLFAALIFILYRFAAVVVAPHWQIIALICAAVSVFIGFVVALSGYVVSAIEANVSAKPKPPPT